VGNALSPTRDLLAYVSATQGALKNVVLDLDTGNVVLSVSMSTPTGGPPSLVWSADGRWLFWVDRGKVMAWSPDRGGDPIEFANAHAGSAQTIAAGYSA
jgi:sugar lactone lactonase YvrE